MHTTRLNLLMQGSIVYSKIQIVTHHYQRFSCSQYSLLVQVQAQQKRLINSRLGNRCNAHTKKRGTHFMFSPIGLPLFCNRLSIRLLNIKKVFLRLVMGLSANL
ncbi:hypothetical protein H5410_055729 [Solanum commersonii]|uniref:Uncharacterized protein n=1 Tax=Solanum commersonii TaxID=4109 RepID=A0A9J5WIC2_SOLCO|nr:hypothetical protein H5410_055729 [Solanum commersonii]